MTKATTLPNQSFGYLTTVSSVKEKGRPSKWLCKCVCNKEILVNTGNLRNGSTKSCGCKTREMRKNVSSTHGMTNTPEFRLWAKLKGFCLNPNHPDYSQYGAKGIIICERWINNFEAFFHDVGLRPSKTATLYRVDPDGNFEPSNCEWREINRIETNKNLTKSLTRKRIDLAGRIFERLTVLSLSHIDKYNNAHWLCQCSCGNTCAPASRSLRLGRAKSCGCLHKDILIQRNTTHGETNSAEYRIWANMINRCYRAANKRYKYYGGKGVAVCDSWKNNFANFLKDMGHRPTTNHSIERIDVNGNYEPSNCIWIPKYDQAANKTTSRILEYNGKRLHLAGWARELGVKDHQLKYLLHDKKLSFPETVAELKRLNKLKT